MHVTSQDKNTTVGFSGRCFYFAVMLCILLEGHLCKPECNVNEKLDFPKNIKLNIKGAYSYSFNLSEELKYQH